MDIVVTASDSPHGSVEFTHPLQIQTEEINTILMLPLQRSFGLIGPLRVNFSVVPDTAVSPEDFTVLNRCELSNITEKLSDSCFINKR